jgi:hypothetical protein
MNESRISCHRHDWTQTLFTGARAEPGLRMQANGDVRMSALLDTPPAFDLLECGGRAAFTPARVKAALNRA